MPNEVSSCLGYTTVVHTLAVLGKGYKVSLSAGSGGETTWTWYEGPCTVSLFPYERANQVHFWITLQRNDVLSWERFEGLIGMVSKVGLKSKLL